MSPFGNGRGGGLTALVPPFARLLLRVSQGARTPASGQRTSAISLSLQVVPFANKNDFPPIPDRMPNFKDVPQGLFPRTMSGRQGFLFMPGEMGFCLTWRAQAPRPVVNFEDMMPTCSERAL